MIRSIRRVFQEEEKDNDEDIYFPLEESEPALLKVKKISFSIEAIINDFFDLKNHLLIISKKFKFWDK